MTSGLLFPKQGKKKRKHIKHKESTLQIHDGRCFLCMILNNSNFYYPETEKHHVFNGPDRQVSEEEGLTVYLCHNHHTDGPMAVHNNRENDLLLKRYAQAAWEQNHTREEFREKFRMSYL